MMAPLDFLAVGHVTVDRLDWGQRLGGAAAYAAITASRLGANAGVVTAASRDFPFWSELESDGVEIHARHSTRTTVFRNRYEGRARIQRLLAVAPPIEATALDAVRPRLSAGACVLYCPVVHEVETPLARLASEGLTAIAPQGWFRAWTDDGRVTKRAWSEDEALAALAGADLVCMSEGDAVAPEALGEAFPGRVFIVTRGESGCRIYAGGDIYDFEAFPANEVDPTGAGDVFATAFLLATAEGRGIPWAARFASAAAALSVEGVGVSAVPTRERVEARL